MRVCGNLNLSLECNFLVTLLQRLFLLGVEKLQDETVFNIAQNCLLIKVTKSDQGTQIDQTCIKLLTLLFISVQKVLVGGFLCCFTIFFIYSWQLAGAVAAEVPGGTRVISHQSETISKFAFHNPHNFTQHSKGRINPNFDNVSTWQGFHGRNYKKYAFRTFTRSSVQKKRFSQKLPRFQNSSGPVAFINKRVYRAIDSRDGLF